MRKFAGIEINKDLISFVLLTEEANSNTVERSESSKLSQISIDDFLRKIKDYISPRDHVSVSLPLEDFIVRKIKVPFRSRDKIEKILKPELEDHIPFDVDKLKTSFSLSDNSSVISFSMDEEIINALLEKFNENTINVDNVTISGLPLSELINQRFNEINKLIIKESGGKISLFFFDKSTLIFAKSIFGKISGDNHRKKISLEMKLILCEIFNRTGSEFKPDRIFLNVSTEYSKIISDFFNEFFGISVEKPELFKNLNEEYVSSSALALYSSKLKETVNFTKKRNPLLFIISEYKNSIVRSAVLASICLLFVILNTAGTYFNSRRVIETYNLKMTSIFRSSFPESKWKGDPYPIMVSKVKELSGSNPEISTGIKKIDILNEINRHISKDIDVVFTKISIAGGVVSISGQTRSFILVDTIKKELDKINFFESVNMSSPTKSGRENRVNFRLNIKLKRV